MSDAGSRRRRHAVEIINWLKTAPCVDCGSTFPSWNMQFDHLRNKIRNVSRMRSSSLKAILDEIEKCDLICANCHGTRSQLRLHLAGKTLIHDQVNDFIRVAEYFLRNVGEAGD